MIGDDVSLVVDIAAVHGLWDVDTAIERIGEWEQFHLRWIERPLRPPTSAATPACARPSPRPWAPARTSGARRRISG